MKSIFTLIFLLLVQVKAEAFWLHVDCWFNQAQGHCRVVNTLPYPVQCQVQAAGRTYYGQALNVWQNVFIYPGQFAMTYVYANNPYVDPLTWVEGHAFCQP